MNRDTYTAINVLARLRVEALVSCLLGTVLRVPGHGLRFFFRILLEAAPAGFLAQPVEDTHQKGSVFQLAEIRLLPQEPFLNLYRERFW